MDDEPLSFDEHRRRREEAANLALSCRSCNLYKGSRLTAPDPDNGDEVPLFHRCSRGWDEHFTLDPDAGVSRPGGLHSPSSVGNGNVSSRPPPTGIVTASSPSSSG